MGTAIKPNKAFNPVGTGTSTYAARYDDARIAALDGVTPTASPAALGATTNMTAITAHTATTAIAGVYADLAAARTSVNALRTDAETALGQHDTALTTLRSEAEARLDAIEAKIDAFRTALIASGVLT